MVEDPTACVSPAAELEIARAIAADHLPFDLDSDCDVGVTDFLLLLANWTPQLPD